MQCCYRFYVRVCSCVIFDGKIELFITIKMSKCASQFDLRLIHSLTLFVSIKFTIEQKRSIFDLSNCLSTYYNRYIIIWLTQANRSSATPCCNAGWWWHETKKRWWFIFVIFNRIFAIIFQLSLLSWTKQYASIFFPTNAIIFLLSANCIEQ